MALASKVFQCHPYQMLNTFLYICMEVEANNMNPL